MFIPKIEVEQMVILIEVKLFQKVKLFGFTAPSRPVELFVEDHKITPPDYLD